MVLCCMMLSANGLMQALCAYQQRLTLLLRWLITACGDTILPLQCLKY